MSKEQFRNVRNRRLHAAATTWFAYQIIYLFDLALIKLSILAFYLSFATNRTFKILVQVSTVLVAACSIAMILIAAFQCPKDPRIALSPAGVKDNSHVQCYDFRKILYCYAGFNITSDLVILILPMPLLMRLHMHTAKRWSLIGVFSAGLLVPIASGIRFWALYLWANSGTSAQYYGGYIVFWSVTIPH
jgi:hypothetical protein